jgi:hypothetical protein
MSVAFLSCADLREFALADHVCCPSCHQRENLIFFVPRYEGSNQRDYTLCIEAMICCIMWDKVAAIPRDWWVRRAEELGVRREDPRGYIYPSNPEKNTERPRSTPKVNATRVRESIKADHKREEEGGLAAFLKRR